MSEEKKKEILEQEKDLGADELDAVAGGKACACVMGGGGEANADGKEKACACVLGGGGEYTDEGAFEKWGNKCRCVCAAIGMGE